MLPQGGRGLVYSGLRRFSLGAPRSVGCRTFALATGLAMISLQAGSSSLLAAGVWAAVMLMSPSRLDASSAKGVAPKSTAASRVLCGHLTKSNDLALCHEGCKIWPADRTCLVIRRFGDLGMGTLVHAVKHKRTLLQVAREAKMPPKEAHALMLWADAANFCRRTWVPIAGLTKNAHAAVQQALRYRRQAVAAQKANKPMQTLQLLRQANSLFLKHLGAKHPHTFETVGQSAYPLIKLRKLKEAQHVLERLLARQRALYGRDHPNVADTLQRLGQVAHGAQRYREAAELWRAALKIAQPVWGADHPKVRVLWNHLAFARKALGDRRGHEKACRQALRIARRVRGPQHIDTATDLTNLGVMLLERGHYAAAEPLLLEGIQIRRRQGAPAAGLAGSYHNLGSLKFLNGEYATARKYLEKAIALWQRGEDSKGLKRSASLLLLGQVLQALADTQGAVLAFTKCKMIRKKALRPDDPSLALVNMQLGQLFDRVAGQQPQGDERTRLLQAAQQLLELAFAQTKRALGPEHEDTYRRLAALASHYVTRRQPGRAIKLLRRAANGLVKRLGPAHSDVARVWNNLGVALSASGAHQQALKTYRRAEALLARAVGGWHPETQSVRINITGTLLRLGKIKAALRQGQQASRQLLGQINAASAAASSDIALLVHVAAHAPLLNVLLSAHAASRDARGGFTQALRWQGVGTRVEALWRQLRRARAASNTANRALLDRYQADQLAVLMRQGAVSGVRGGMGGAQTRSLQALRTAVRRTEKKLARSIPTLSVQASLLQPSVARVCRSLQRRKSSLVDYISYVRLPDGERRYAAYAVDPRGCKVSWVDLGSRASIDRAVASWRSALAKSTACLRRRGKAQFCGKSFRRLDEAGLLLRGLVWAPVADAAGRAKRTWIVPAGTLSTVAFDALPDGKGRYLIEDRTLAYLPYPAAAIGGNAARGGQASGALVMGDVDYQSAIGRSKDAVAGWQLCKAKGGCALSAPASKRLTHEMARTAVTRGDAICGRGGGWSQLPITEANTVAAQLAGSISGRIWLATGAHATEASIRTAMPKRRFIHLATHGFFADPVACGRPADPRRVASLLQRSVADGAATPLVDPMSMSGVVLSGANRSCASVSPARDGVLSGREVARMDLRGTELVVLSACETGLGVRAADEGALGLSRAFMVAGAAHTVVSLWQVPSRETRRLFEGFYAALVSGKHRGDVAGAMRVARLKLLRDFRSRKQGASTFLWAAFVPFANGL